MFVRNIQIPQWCPFTRCWLQSLVLLCTEVVEGVVVAWTRPPRPEGVWKRDSRNLGHTFFAIYVHVNDRRGVDKDPHILCGIRMHVLYIRICTFWYIVVGSTDRDRSFGGVTCDIDDDLCPSASILSQLFTIHCWSLSLSLWRSVAVSKNCIQTYPLRVTPPRMAQNCHRNQMVPYCVTVSR